MVRRRLDAELHGSTGFTTIPRVVAVTACLAFLILSAHLAIQAWYAGRILPGVVAAGKNIGGMSLPQARAVLKKEAAAYQLQLTVNGQVYRASAAQLGVTFDPETTLTAAYQTGRNSWLPPAHTEPLPLAYQVDRPALDHFASSVAAQVGVQPVDAGVVFVNGTFQTVPDKSGVTVDRLGLERIIETDLRFPTGNQLQLKPRPQVADIQASALGPTLADAQRLIATPIVLSYADKTFAPKASDIGQWVAFDKQETDTSAKLVPKIDTAKLKSYVQQIANQIDTAPVSKKVTIENGVSKTDQDGVDGLAIDQDPVVAAVAEAVTKNQPLTFTITTHSVPFKTISNTVITLDYGRYIEISLSKQHLWVWQDHNVIYESPITSGATGMGFPTVTGLFSIYYKTTNTHLVGAQYGPRYNYDVFVQYWMPFYQGFGLHDASWRNGVFGGPDYYYNGSHGCVNLPLATAEFLYNWADIGTPVWVHS
ncbi:MAG TPA: peptidoglycan binding domain-containing protein [Candidatus Saccharimonadia bacterium]|nr:peptidoglycan binding domain-containing protein [Candidatus Saccharimonadia bacterium]